MLLAQTKGSSLIKEINNVLRRASHYVSENDFWFKRQQAEAEKLKGVNAREAYNVLAQLYGLAGNVGLAEKHIDTALRLQHDPLIMQNKAVILSNLGFFSRAVEPFALSTEPESGFFTNHWRLGICLGSFHLLAEFLRRARTMQLDLTGIDAALIEQVVQFMDARHLADEQLTRALDVVGGVLRARCLFFAGDGPEVMVWNDDPLETHLSIVFRVVVPLAESIALDEELGQRLLEQCPDLPSEVMLHFESGTSPDEYHAERPAVAG